MLYIMAVISSSKNCQQYKLRQTKAVNEEFRHIPLTYPLSGLESKMLADDFPREERPQILNFLREMNAEELQE